MSSKENPIFPFRTQSYTGELTYAGVLQKYYIEYDSNSNNVGISAGWDAESTTSNYTSDFNNRLIPTINELKGEGTPLSELTADDFERVLTILRNRHHYTDVTVDHYRHLILLVYRAGVEHGLYVDKLQWDDTQPLPDNLDKLPEDERQKIFFIRKSLSTNEELKMLDHFWNLNPETAEGREIGTYFMYVLGTRNNEACGFQFKNIHSLEGHPDIYVADVVQTTQIGSNALKAGGKTSNAPRTLIVPKKLYKFIQERKRYISSEYPYLDVDELPIVCHNRQFEKRATASELTAYGRELLQKIGISKSQMALLADIITSTEFQDEIYDEKSVTTYLFRRNTATRLYTAGLPLEDIQYWMGHEIEDGSIQRNFYADPDKLAELANNLKRHPVYQMLDEGELKTWKTSVQVEKSGEYLLQTKINVPKSDNFLTIHMETNHSILHAVKYQQNIDYQKQFNISAIMTKQYAIKKEGG